MLEGDGVIKKTDYLKLLVIGTTAIVTRLKTLKYHLFK